MGTHRLLTLAVLGVAAAAGACKETVVNVLPVASVMVTGSSGALLLGQSVQLSASPRDDRNGELSNRTVTWSSSNPGVAAVNGGLVQAVGTGSATITAAVEGVSGTLALTVNNPAPNVSSLAPDNVVVGSAGFQLTVTGSGFIPASVVVWSSQDRTTTYVDGGTLKASITAADVAMAGSFNVTVRNPQPGGGSSSARAFAVNNPLPVITSLSPNNALFGGAGFELTVMGTGFMQGSVVRWGGQDRGTRVVSATTLKIDVVAADIAAPALVDVTVVNPAPGGGASQPSRFLAWITPPGPAISSRGYHTCALRTNGEVYCWGRNDNGQLGNGSTTDRAGPTRVSSSLDFVSVVAGAWHTCGLTSWGAAYCWGHGTYVGGGTGGSSTSTPVAVQGGHRFVQLGAGWAHTCGITEVGALYCWGWNNYGQLGDGSTTTRQAPVEIGSGQTWRAVFGGFGHTCALTTAGRLFCWGDNGSGQLGDGTTTDRLVPTPVSSSLVFTAGAAGSSHTCALATGGAAHCWGWGGRLGNGSYASSSTPVAVSGGQSFTVISAGTNHTCAVTQSGATWCWGYSDSGQLGDGRRVQSNVPVAPNVPPLRDIATAELHTCGITTTGAAYCWGERAYGGLGDGEFGLRTSPIDVSRASSGYTAVAVGWEFTCGLSGTSPYCWGGNEAGQLGDGTTVDRTVPTPVAGSYSFSQIATGSNHVCATAGGLIASCWGAGGSGQLGNGASSNSLTPVTVSGGQLFNYVSAGNAHSCGVSALAEVWCWGYNSYGQVGDGTTTGRFAPTRIAGVSGLTFTRVSASYNHTCAVTSTGQLYCWGSNNYGQLGDGTTTNRATPVQVNVGAAVASVSAGFYHTCALTTAGAAFCWGFNGVGELGTGSGSDPQLRPVAVTGGLTFRTITTAHQRTCGVTTAGVAYCWGVNDWGQLGTGSFAYASAPAPVAGGGTYQDVRTGIGHTCGLTTGGGVRCWGRLRWGELGIGISGVVLTPAPVQGSVIFDAVACAAGGCGRATLARSPRGPVQPRFVGPPHLVPRPRLEPVEPPTACRAADEPCPRLPLRVVQ